MRKGKIFIFALGSVLLFLSGLIGVTERVFQPGTFVPAALGIALLIFALLWKRIVKFKIFKVFLFVLFGGGVAIYLVAEVFVFSGICPPSAGEHKYAIVLGCGLYGEAPSELLSERLETAKKYAQAYPDCKLVLSGGQGYGEAISEAEAMRRYFIQAGIAPERLILEANSRNTYENLRNVKQVLDERDGAAKHDCVIISNDFHLYRAKRLSKIVGISADTLAAPTPVGTVGMFLREGISVIFSWLRYW